ncbi:MAG: hypothetical protein HOL08_08020, partial [Opitutae bacterium]|nr:hypothetical protein [Opitutae bacterium]
GGDPGVSTVMQYRLKDGIGYIILMNGEPKGMKFEQALGQRLLNFPEKAE